MIKYEKIPSEAKKIGAISIGGFAVFCVGILKAAKVIKALEKRNKIRKGLPIVGSVKMGKEKIFYCRYGFVSDPDIYKTDE